MTDDVQRDLGRHDAEIKNLQRSVEEMAEDVHAIKEMMAEMRGGKKAVVILASAAASMGAFVGWLLSIIQHKPEGVP